MDNPNVVKLNNLKGLSLVDFYVFVHYLDKWESLVEEERKIFNGKVICLTDQQAITKEGLII